MYRRERARRKQPHKNLHIFFPFLRTIFVPFLTIRMVPRNIHSFSFVPVFAVAFLVDTFDFGG